MAWILPEYCDAVFYTGWHIYLRDRPDGSMNDDGGWGWIRRSFMITHEIAEYVSELRPAAPKITYTLNTSEEIRQWNAFVKWLAREFPSGLEWQRVGGTE